MNRPSPSIAAAALRQRLAGDSGAAGLVFVLKMAGAAISVGVVIALGRAIDADGYGRYALALGIANLIVVPISGGLHALTLREIASEDRQNRATFSAWVGRTSVSLSLIAAALGAAVVFVLPMSPPQQSASLAGLLLVPVLARLRIAEAALQATRRPLAAQLPDGIVRPALYLVGILVWMAIGSIEPVDAMLLHGAAGFLAAVVAIVLLRPVVDQPPTKPSQRQRLEWRRAVVPLAVASTLFLAMEWADVLMLGALAAPADVGAYYVARRIVALIAVIELAVNAVFSPDFVGTRETPELQGSFTRATRLMIFGTLPLVLFVILLDEQLLGLAGDGFTAASGPLTILVLVQLGNVIVGPLAMVLLLNGHQGAVATRLAVALGINIASNAVLIPMYGANGAAVATAFSLMVWNGLLALLLRSTMRVRVGPFLTSLPAR